MADESLTQEVTTDFSKLKVPDLKKELKLRGLSTTGNKNELIERLQKTVKADDSVGSKSVDDLEEDLLNEDDDDEHLDASESVILENDLDESPKAKKRKLSESSEPEEPAPVPAKKIILTRHTSITDIVVTPEVKTAEPEPAEVKEEKRIIKLSQLTAKDRLEMRAKKFGVTALNPDAKKVVRAERFKSSDSSAASFTSATVNTSIDVLKQRAKRFGTSGSPILSKLENQEKLEMRKAKFAGASNGSDTVSEKAKLRLEKFKQAVK